MRVLKKVVEPLEDKILAWSLCVVLYLGSMFFYNMVFPFSFPLKIIGHKTVSIFDLWSIQHFFTGIVLGGIVSFIIFDTEKYPHKKEFYRTFIYLAICWEFFETLMEVGKFGYDVLLWKNGVEHWTNRFIGDPTMMLLGGYVYRKYRSFFWSSLLLACFWLILNIFMPNCMSIQELIISSLDF